MINHSKKIAAGLIFTMGLMTAAPVLAAEKAAGGGFVIPRPSATASANTASTEDMSDSTVYTMEQIQDLAQKNNRNSKSYELQLKVIEENRMSLGNQWRELDDQIDRLGYPTMPSEADQLKAAIADVQQQIAAASEPAEIAGLKAQLMLLQSQLDSITNAVISGQSQVESGLQSIVSGKDQIDSGLNTLDNTKADTVKSQQDWNDEIKLVSGMLVLKTLEVQGSVELAQKNYDLALQLRDLEQLKADLGLSTEVTTTGKTVEASQAATALQQAQNGLATLKRQLNDLTGRPLDKELNLAPYTVTATISPAPAQTKALEDKFIANDYTLKTYQRDIQDLKDNAQDLKDADGTPDSNQLGIIDRQIELKQLAIEQQKVTVVNNLKSQLEKINNTGRVYREQQIAYDKAAQTFEHNKLQKDLGLLSDIAFKGAELAMTQAELSKMQAAYDYYLAWEEYKAMEKGVSLTTYSQFAGM